MSLKEITVTPGNFSILGSSQLSQQTMSEEDIKNMFWAEDITRVVARLPGISSSDYSSKFAIRGGESDEVLIALDGMELYEPFHQRDFSGGLFSIVDIETIQGIEFMTGGFSADHGNRLVCILFFAIVGMSNCTKVTSKTTPGDNFILTGINTLTLAKQLKEASGIEMINEESLLLQNDAGNSNEIHIVYLRGQLQRSIRLTGVENNDWEDLAQDFLPPLAFMKQNYFQRL